MEFVPLKSTNMRWSNQVIVILRGRSREKEESYERRTHGDSGGDDRQYECLGLVGKGGNHTQTPRKSHVERVDQDRSTPSRERISFVGGHRGDPPERIHQFTVRSHYGPFITGVCYVG